MSELSQLIEIAKGIEKQNTEIIRLLKKIAGEVDENETKRKSPIDFTPDFGELYISGNASRVEKESEEIVNTYQIGTLLENAVGPGEVYFIDGPDIFKLTVKNNEKTIDNLTGEGEPGEFALQEMIANESIRSDSSLDDSSVILSAKQSQNLAETLRICVEQGARKVYMPLYSSAQLAGAPQIILKLIKFDFYKSEEHLIEKLFG